MKYLIIIFIVVLIVYILEQRSKKKTKNLKPNKENETLKNPLAIEWEKWEKTFNPENSTEPFRSFNTKVVGVTFKNKNGSSRQKIISKCKNNEKLILIPELYKEPDTYAIMVCRENFEQIGYLSSVLAEEISDLMIRRKSRVDAKVSSLTGGNGQTKGINIEIQKYLLKSKPKRIKKEAVSEKPYDPNVKMHRFSYERNQQAYELEKNGYIENAIELYRSIIDNKNLQMNNASMPFSRLTIIYRKRKEYDKEIEVINKWKESLIKSVLNEERKEEEMEKLDKRLAKAILLKNKTKKQ